MAIPAALIVAGTLAVALVESIDAVRSRRALEWDVPVAQLACLEDVIVSRTTPGEVIRIEATDEPYLMQRVAEIAFPRIGLTDDPSATALVVRVAQAGEDATCGLVVEVER